LQNAPHKIKRPVKIKLARLAQMADFRALVTTAFERAGYKNVVQAARALDWTPPRFHNYLTELRVPGPNEMAKIAETFGVSVADIMPTTGRVAERFKDAAEQVRVMQDQLGQTERDKKRAAKAAARAREKQLAEMSGILSAALCSQGIDPDRADSFATLVLEATRKLAEIAPGIKGPDRIAAAWSQVADLAGPLMQGIAPSE
jgi:hypothetical protein